MSAGFRTLAIVALLLVSVSPLARAEFCQDLRIILDASDTGFTELRGELISRHQDPLSDTRVVWECAHTLSGVQTCEIEWRLQVFTYNTFWHREGEDENRQVFEALTELLDGCGLVRKASSRTGRSRWYVIEENEAMDITLAYNARRVRLSCAAAGFPNP